MVGLDWRCSEELKRRWRTRGVDFGGGDVRGGNEIFWTMTNKQGR
jgi:hypothetical protein